MKELVITQQITQRDSRSIELYFNEVSKYDLLTADEEVELAQRIKEGDEAALEKLVKANLRFVVSVAKQYQHSKLSLSDLISEGNLGLIIAAKRFDETRGFKFISYAVWWIRQSILKAIAEHTRTIRLPHNKIGAINKINRAFSELEQLYHREPTDKELADCLDMDEKTVKESIEASKGVSSINAPIVKDDEMTLENVLTNRDMPSTDEDLVKDSLKKEISRTLSVLSNQEREVIELLYGLTRPEKLSLQEVGDKLGLSSERVRQIRQRALNRLRKSCAQENLRVYL